MKTVQHDDIQSLLGAYAIDAVDSAERALVDDHLPRCSECRVEVDRHREVAGLLAVGAEPISDEVPPTLWSRIETGIDTDDTTLAPVVRLADHRRARRTMLFAGSAAAILTLVVGFQALRISTLDSELAAADARVDALEQAVATAPYEEMAKLAATNPDATTVSLAGDAGLVMTAVILPDGTGILVPESVRPLDSQHTYQLWAVQDGQVISAGVLGSEPGFVPFRIDPELLEGLVITAENAGGVPVSSQPAIAAWFPDA
jgi:anti-sigma factor RsiW